MKWYHNDYSEEALAEMQKEAERRVEEGRERARLLAGAALPKPARQICTRLPSTAKLSAAVLKFIPVAAMLPISVLKSMLAA